MTKSELIAAVSAKAGVSKVEADKVVASFLEVVSEELVKGEKVRLPEFGGFEVKERAARAGKNPQTGETIQIAASKAVSFKAAKALKERL